MEKIKIVKLGRKQQPSKFKPGETYSITTIMDDKNRKLAAMGRWAEDWKVDDVIEAEIEEKKWTDKDGFEQVSLNIKNPNQKPFTPGGRGFFNPKITAYQLAATLAPILFGDKKKITLKDIDALADELKKRIEVTSQSTEAVETKKKEDVPEVDVDDDDVEVKDEDDDERPF